MFFRYLYLNQNIYIFDPSEYLFSCVSEAIKIEEYIFADIDRDFYQKIN